jgi:hypothetical protein
MLQRRRDTTQELEKEIHAVRTDVAKISVGVTALLGLTTARVAVHVGRLLYYPAVGLRSGFLLGFHAGLNGWDLEPEFGKREGPPISVGGRVHLAIRKHVVDSDSLAAFVAVPVGCVGDGVKFGLKGLKYALAGCLVSNDVLDQISDKVHKWMTN